MELKEYIEKLTPLVETIFASDSSGHDMGHMRRTMNLALTICKEEGGDEIVVGIASFLHDIHRIMQTQTGRFVHPRESLPKVREILAQTDLSESVVDEICLCIENHENYNWNDGNVTNLNALIVQDADNLDAIGAIGVARVFVYGGANNIPIYDEKIPLVAEENYVEDSINDVTSVHHFYTKILRLGDYMNTETAKKIAKKRTEFVKTYLEEFLAEWNGER